MTNTGVEREENIFDILEADQVLESSSRKFKHLETDQSLDSTFKESEP